MNNHDMNAHAPPWDYNPSAWRERVPIAIFALVVFFIATSMALYQWRLLDSVWDPIFGEQTHRVLDSHVSERMRTWFGIPDAALGAIAYLSDAVFALAESTRRWQYRPWLVIIFGLDVIPLGAVSAVLVVLQGSVVGDWCFLWVVTAAISLRLIWYGDDEVWSCLLYLRRVWRKSRNPRLLWDTFCGRASLEANEVALTR